MTLFARLAITVSVKENNIPPRSLSRFVIMARLKRVGVRQGEIAQRAHVTQGTVSRVLARTLRDTQAAQRVWREIERALEGAA